jgi:nitroreductase
MRVSEAIAKRRSVREYLDKPVPEDVLMRVMEAARLAPSAKNRQEWRFIVVRDKEIRRKVVQATNDQVFVGTAPIILVFCATEDTYTMRCGQKGGPIDASIAFSYVTLAAMEEGLGTCWIGSFYEDKLKPVLGIPAEARIIGLTPLGYPAEEPAAKSRKPFGEVVSFDRW